MLGTTLREQQRFHAAAAASTSRRELGRCSGSIAADTTTLRRAPRGWFTHRAGHFNILDCYRKDASADEQPAYRVDAERRILLLFGAACDHANLISIQILVMAQLSALQNVMMGGVESD